MSASELERYNRQMLTIVPGKGPCLRCIFPKTPPEVEGFPVLGTTPVLLAAFQVMAAIKLITGVGEPLAGRILFINWKEMARGRRNEKKR